MQLKNKITLKEKKDMETFQKRLEAKKRAKNRKFWRELNKREITPPMFDDQI